MFLMSVATQSHVTSPLNMFERITDFCSAGTILILHASVDIARIRTRGVLVLFDNFAVRSANTGIFANNLCATLIVDSGTFGDFKISPHPNSNVWSILTYMTEANISCY